MESDIYPAYLPIVFCITQICNEMAGPRVFFFSFLLEQVMKYSVFFSSQVDGMGFVTVALTQTSQDSIPI